MDHSQRKGIVTLDASKYGELGSKPGLGAYNLETHKFYYRPVPDHMVDWDIGDLELVNHLVVARVWGPTWAGVEVTGYTDKQSAIHLLRHGRSLLQLRLDIAREFASLQQNFHFLWQAEYVNTKDNVLSDCLSRWGSTSARETFAQYTAGIHISEIFIPDSDDLTRKFKLTHLLYEQRKTCVQCGKHTLNFARCTDCLKCRQLAKRCAYLLLGYL